MPIRRVIERIMEQPWAYRLWQAPFADQKFRPVARHLLAHPPRRVLDVGCGPGTNAPRFAGIEYVGVDINEDYLQLARERYQGRFVQADLASADLDHLGTFDFILVNSFLHHLPDAAVDRILQGIGRRLSPGGRVHILELVVPPRPTPARLMAWLDRGRYARSMEEWRRIFERHFATEVVTPYTLGGFLWAMVYFCGGEQQ